jgi:hypothetical protein
MLTLHASLQSAINAGTATTTVDLLRLENAAGTSEYRTSHIHNITALSQTWEADGLWLGMSTIRLDSRNVDETWTVELDLTDSNIVNANYDGGRAWYYVGYLGSSGSIIGDPVLIAQGDISDDDDEETLEGAIRRLRVHNFLWADQFEPTQNARTEKAHIERFPGDHIFGQTALLRRTNFRVGGVKPID